MMDGGSTFPGYSIALEWIKNIFSRTIKTSNCVPQHVGFVMDGNRRYARRNDIDIKEGHEAGFSSMSQVLELCYEAGVNTATVFAFSIENFKRSPSEVDHLMKLAREKIRQLAQHGEMADRYGIRVRVIGDLSLLPKGVYEDIVEATEKTKNNTRATLNICFPYTSREEIFHSIKDIIAEGITSKNINEATVESHLYTGADPPLELLVRTSGVTRLSDFLLWQVSEKGVVIELFDCLWPDFGPLKMAWVLLKFAFRKSFSDKEHILEDDDGALENQDVGNYKKAL